MHTHKLQLTMCGVGMAAMATAVLYLCDRDARTLIVLIFQ